MYTLRFDMRSPSGGTATAELYAAALEMTSWAETHGAIAVFLSEHHGLRDGYLPSPLMLASAMAARTSSIHIMTAVVILPLYDPVRLAEDMIVLDIISRGRASAVCAVGYRSEEYAMFGQDFAGRGRAADDKLRVLLQAKTGEPFDLDGAQVCITPAPFTPGGPAVLWGGGSAVAARRAGRFGIDFFGQSGDPALLEVYENEARRHGHEPGGCLLPAADMATTVFVADDVDRAWDELGPYLMHDVTSYAAMNEGAGDRTSMSAATTADELRAENRSHRIVTVPEAVELARIGYLNLHPLVGGLPPEIAWPYLRRAGEDVMAALATA